MKHVADLLKSIPEEFQIPIGMAIAMIGLAFAFVLVCFGMAILKLSGVV